MTARASVARIEEAADKHREGAFAAVVAQKGFELSDVGNAQRLGEWGRYRFIYVHDLGKWFRWESGRWRLDIEHSILGDAVDAARGVHAEASLTADFAKQRQITRHAAQSQRKERLEAALYIARSFPVFARRIEQLDADPYLLNVQNGTIDLRTGALRPHRREDNLTRQAPVEFDPDAKAPRWLAFLAKIIPDPEVLRYLQRAIGYSLTGDVGEHALFFAFGRGANGKSTFLEMIRAALGEGEYAAAATPDLLLARKTDRHLAELADLRGFRFVTTIETGEGRSWDEARVKSLTGGDAIRARHLYQEAFTFTPSHKFWIAGNHRPRVHGTDLGFWRRLHCIPFEVTIPEEERDRDLKEKLRKELPGILAWAVAGAAEWHRSGLQAPAAVRAATASYRSDEDQIGAFIEEACEVRADARYLVGELFDAFRRWAEQSNEKTMTKRAFGDALEERGLTREVSHGRRYMRGIALRQITEADHG